MSPLQQHFAGQGFTLSLGKGFSPQQSRDFTGLCLDTVAGLVTAQGYKLAGVVDWLLDLRGLEYESRWAVTPGQGKQFTMVVPFHISGHTQEQWQPRRYPLDDRGVDG